MNNDTTTTDKLKALEKDFDFERLELNLKLPNIFRILKISKAEIRHSNFLAWLLDPNEGHNLKDIFLKRFLLDIEVDFDVAALQNIEIRREWKNIDLLIIIFHQSLEKHLNILLERLYGIFMTKNLRINATN